MGRTEYLWTCNIFILFVPQYNSRKSNISVIPGGMFLMVGKVCLDSKMNWLEFEGQSSLWPQLKTKYGNPDQNHEKSDGILDRHDGEQQHNWLRHTTAKYQKPLWTKIHVDNVGVKTHLINICSIHTAGTIHTWTVSYFPSVVQHAERQESVIIRLSFPLFHSFGAIALSIAVVLAFALLFSLCILCYLIITTAPRGLDNVLELQATGNNCVSVSTQLEICCGATGDVLLVWFDGP